MATSVIALIALSALPFAGATANLAEYQKEFVCEPPDGYSEDELKEVTERNAGYVNAWARELQDEVLQDELHNLFSSMSDRQRETQRDAWVNRSAAAQQALNVATELSLLGDYFQAANWSINAWGSIVRRGRECCALNVAPYCVDQKWSASTIALMVPPSLLVVLFLAAVAASLYQKSPKPPSDLTKQDGKQDDRSAARVEDEGRAGRALLGLVTGRSELQVFLEREWNERSCLRTLPDNRYFAVSSASIFSALTHTFKFQEDNAKNQHQHLLSLLRSQLSMVADRQYEADGTKTEDKHLLREALGDLHAELLEGFLKWRQTFEKCSTTGMKSKEGLPSMGGAKWDHLKAAVGEDHAELSRQLAEIAAFLLVWGEAGNLRFMPEVLYFLTDLVLTASSASLNELYQLRGWSEPSHQSSLFLAKVVRPFYLVVFDETYDKVDVNAANKDAKKLKDGFDAFLPSDVANYDDWNELFCDPDRLAASMWLRDGKPLFEHERSERFKQLVNVNWEVSLQACATKTHNELHSLWGIFAGIHRVVLLHSFLFWVSLVLMCGDPPALPDGASPLGGRSLKVRMAAPFLVVPVHALGFFLARWKVTGPALRPRYMRCGPCVNAFGWCKRAWREPHWRWEQARGILRAWVQEPPLLFYLLPAMSYVVLRNPEKNLNLGILSQDDYLNQLLMIHYAVSGVGLFYLLLVPTVRDQKFPFDSLTRVPLHSRALRYAFWVAVFAAKVCLGLVIIGVMSEAIDELEITRPGRQPIANIKQLYDSTRWGEGVLLWVILWGSTFALYLADTAMWFVIFCSFLGTLTTLVQRHLAKNKDLCAMGAFIFEDAVCKIPQRFSEKVLCFTQKGVGRDRSSATFSVKFPAVWDRIMQYMAYEDDIGCNRMGELSFDVGASGRHVYWEDLSKPVGWARDPAAETGGALLSSRLSAPTGTTTTPGSQRVKVPGIFNRTPYAQRCLQTYTPCMRGEGNNADVQWRLLALSRGLGLPMPRPYRAPYIPGITVLIPHYGETILMQKKELFQPINETVPLINWLVNKYSDEFDFFTSRMQARGQWPVVGSEWEQYTEYQWRKICNWASYRQQTLFRTVAGMCYYHPAIQAHMELQGDRASPLSADGVWDPSDVFTCLVSMQMYRFFDKTFLEHTDYMLEKFPACLKIAYIDTEVKGSAADADNVHARQARRYYSCLIDKSCPADGSSGRRRPKFKIELPGYPILGDGKGDNQNHAIPFMRGHYSQGIDANQGAYFEQLMLLPCALGEFRGKKRGDGSGKKILGFPEHITSDIGSVGDFAASAEVAFGTILQRTYSVLGARMHYGHPDIMNKLCMMQQGGVSKATKTLNLSEDIFAGFDFTLRGDGRQIKHCEYLNLAKGRDLGFNTVLGFFSKLSSGTGEQVLTRQVYRLGQVLHLPETLGIFYAHAGYYLNQFLVSWATPLLVFVWLLILLSDCEGTLDAFQLCEDNGSAAEAMTEVLSTCYSWLMLLFIFGSSLPLFMELWMQKSFKDALAKLLQGYMTMSPFLFVFQAKCIGHYVVNEFRYGGATYVATGRGLPTERRPFVGEMKKDGYFRMARVGGLFLDYARIAYYDGALLLVGLIFVYLAGGVTSETAPQLIWMFVSCGLTLVAWLYAPFIFNPYQFVAKHFKEDARALCAFFFEKNGTHWLEWYTRTQLKAGHGLSKTLVDVTFFLLFFFVTTWYVVVTVKVELLVNLFSEYPAEGRLYGTLLLPPVFASLAFCIVVACVESLFRCSTSVRRGLGSAVRERRKKAEEADEEKGVAAWWQVKPSRKNEDFKAADGGPSSGGTLCGFGAPLPLIAAFVILFDVAELSYTLFDIWTVSWNNALLSGVILKLTLLSAAIMLGEGVLVSQVFARVTSFWAPLGLPLETWVTAHRMARDLFVSLLIFLPLSMLVLLNSVNECLCPGCNVHHLCLYRDPGTQMRKEKTLDFGVEFDLDVSPPTQAAMAQPASPRPPPSPLSSSKGSPPVASPVSSSRGAVPGGSQAGGSIWSWMSNGGASRNTATVAV